MRKLIVVGLLAAAAYAAPANAAQTVTYSPGSYSLPDYTTAGIFQNFEGGAGDGSAFVANAALTTSLGGPASESTTGDVATASGSLPGDFLSPQPGANKYLAIQNGSYAINFGAAGVQFLSFVFGSLDSYNSVTLNFTSGPSVTYFGKDIETGTNSVGGAGPIANFGDTGRVSYDMGGGPAITSVVFGSTQAAFEIDDIAAAAPEPAAWALMILGFGLAGAQLRSRRSKTNVQFA
jgi:hypothetical protein